MDLEHSSSLTWECNTCADLSSSENHPGFCRMKREWVSGCGERCIYSSGLASLPFTGSAAWKEARGCMGQGMSQRAGQKGLGGP